MRTDFPFGCSFPSVPLPRGTRDVSPSIRPDQKSSMFPSARGFALFLLDRLQIGQGGRVGPAGLVEAVAVKAAEGMKVVVVQGADSSILRIHHCVALVWFWLGSTPRRKCIVEAISLAFVAQVRSISSALGQ